MRPWRNTVTHIMVVDDSPTIRASVSCCVQNAGYTVTKAADGQDALDKITLMEQDGLIPSLIITDVNMPKMDGIIFIKNIKKSSLRYIPILVLTTESEGVMVEKGKASGASGWLIKPFQPEQLLRAIKKLIWAQ